MMRLYRTLLFLLLSGLVSNGFAQTYTMTNGTVNTCSGTFYDSGGNFGNYNSGEDLTFTICPSGSGQIAVTFTVFDVEAGWDQLVVYDGANTAAPTLGAYDNGTGSPGTVQATTSNASGCLTFHFTSDGSVQYGGWSANITCTNPCQTVQAVLNSTSPAVGPGGAVQICQGDNVNFQGSGSYPDNGTYYVQSDGTSTFLWDFGDGTTGTGQNVNHSYPNSGVYLATLTVTDVQGCVSTNQVLIPIEVSTTPVFAGTNAAPDPICLGETSTLTGVATPVEASVTCTNPISGTTFLPDGSGVSYTTSMTVSCYAAGQTVNNLSDITEICMDLEHSYLGDLDIVIECPDGSTMDILDYTTQTGGGAILGEPVAVGLPVDDNTADVTPGNGYTYCWTPTAINGNLDNNAVLIGNYTDPVGNTSTGVSQVPAGTYQADGLWTNLLGCPLNGDWSIIVTDNLGSDNGYIFNWYIGFDPAITPAAYQFTPTIVSETWQAAPGLVNGAGGTATVTPTSTGVNCYTYEVQDDFGCTYDTTICITVNPGLNLTDQVVNLCENPAGSGTVSNVDLTALENAIDGGAGYTFSWYNDAALSSSVATPNNVTVSDGQVFYAQGDDGNCTAVATVTYNVTSLTPPTMASTDETCDGQDDGTATATPVGMTAPVNYSWNTTPVQTSNPATGLAPGTYTVTVTDASGCSVTNTVTINAGPVINAVIDPIGNQCLSTNSFTFNGGNSTVSAGTITSYNWNFGDGNTATGASPTHVYSGSGTYTVTLTVSDGTCTDQVTQNVTVFDEPTVTASGTNVLCFGANNGTLNATASGTSGYTYAWDIPAAGASQTGIGPGTYTVTVTDVNGCTDTDSYTITEPTQLSLTATGTNMSCFGVCDGTLDATIGGGTLPYAITWDGGPTPGTEDQTGVCQGTYTITVTDANGCVETASYTVTEPAQLTATSAATNMTCFGVCDGTLDATVGGGTPGYLYNWDGGPTPGVEDQTGVCQGTYTLTVTDANGCQATATSTITQPAQLTVTASGTNVSCNGVCDGTLSSIVTGGTGAITYAWDNGAGAGATATAVCANTYTLTVTDANGCTANDSYTVTEPPALGVTIAGVDASCNGVCDGQATANVTGGTGPFTYQWDDPGLSTTAGLTGLCAGNFNVAVTDANGCTANSSVTINEPTAIVVTTGSNDANCGASDGDVSANATGGAGGYSYSWSNSVPTVVGTTANVAGLPSGTYTVTVTDASGCTATDVAIINTTSGGIASATVDNQVSCNGACDGQATASIAGGTAPFTYAWSDGQNTATATGLCPGNYSVDVTDNNGCLSSASITITEPPVLVVAITSQSDPLCALSCDGTANANVAGGTPGYTYSWTSGGTSANETGMCDGTHTLTVTDANGCVETADVTLTDPPVLTTNVDMTPVDCNGNCNGAADLTVNGGTGVISYVWDNAATSEDISALCAGTYNVTVTDANGCTANDGTTVTEPTALALTMSGNDEICSQSNGDVGVVATGGTIAADYTYAWTDGGGSPVGSTATLTGLGAGTYTVVVTDDNGCTVTDNITIGNQTAGTLAVTLDNDASCASVCDGAATATMTGGTPGFTYAWDNGETTQQAVGLCVGTHNVTVTDANGCALIGSVVVTEPAPMTLTIMGTDPLCNGVNDGSADATVSGGTMPYIFAWQHGPTVEDLNGVLGSGTYVLDVTDANGCTVSASVTLTDPPAITSSITGNDISCNGAMDGDATVTASGGTGTLVYNWAPAPAGGQGTATATGLDAQTYTVTVTDDNGCVVTESFTPAEPTALVLTPSATQSNCGQADGSVDVAVAGGTPIYTYLWEDAVPNPVGVTSNVTGLAAGVYTVTVTDQNGCQEIATATITDASGATLSYTFVDAFCNGSTDGLIDLTVTGGTPGFTYAWTGPGAFTNTNEDISNLPAGTYDVTVTDAVGCVATESVVIGEPAALTVTPTADDASCFGSTDGEVSAGATGGTAGYTFEWYDNPALTNNIGSGSTITGLAAGTYYVEVTDANGCTADAQIDVNEPAAIVVTTNSANANCGLSDGSVSVTSTTGGSGVYVSEVWMDATPAVVANPAAVPAGTYTVTVTDDNGCTGTGIANVADVAGPATNLLGSVPVSCFGECDGSANVEVTGGTLPYTYVWSPVPGGGQGTATITGLCAGTYTLTTTDANGCQDNFTVTITEPTPVDVTITASTDVSGFGLSDGDASAIGSGGTPGYTYEWYNGCPPGATTGQTGTNATGLSAGDYSVILTDSKGCLDTTCVTINEPGAISTNLNVVDVTCFGACDGSVTVAASGGVPGYSYAWFDGLGAAIGQTGVTATNLCAGDYYVEVTDQNGVTATSATVTVAEPTLITGTTSVLSNYNGADVSCNGACDGQAQVVPTGGTPTYSYLWSNGQTSDIATGLCAGNYDVDVTDQNGCVQTFSVTLTEPQPLVVVVTGNDASCFGVCDGDVTATPADGTAPYTYQWDDPSLSTTQTVTGLCDGVYNVTVADANGCTAAGTFTINEPTEIVLDSDSTESNCGQTDGSATVFIVSGDGPLTQQWDAAAGSVTTATANGLGSGCYDVTVTDVHGCTQDRTICVTDAGSPLVEILTLTDASCKDTCDGFAQVQVTPGTNSVPPLSFEWFDSSMTPIGQSTASATGLCAGNYIAEMTDANGCVATVAVTIDEPTVLNASVTTSTDVTCFGDCDGQATVVAGGGTAAYTYAWNDAANQTTATATGLCPAGYTVTVTDANGCTTTVPTTIGEPLQILATATGVDAFCNTASGSASVTIDQGGVGTLSYVWTPTGQTTNPATGLLPGTYDVIITDSDGCTGNATATVGDIPASVATAQVVSDVSCNAICDGEATVSVGGTGTPPYTYEWYDVATGTPIGQTTQNATGLCAGDYYCVATDVNTCQSVSDTITITEPAALTLTSFAADADCKNGCDGTATVNPLGGTAPYTYLWDDPLMQNLQTASNLCAGTYNVIVTDDHGCTETIDATVGEPLQIDLDSTVVNANCNQADGSACVIASGGTGPYTYSWPTAETSNCATGLIANSYLVTVTDANFCTQDIVIEVSDLSGPTAAITASSDALCNGSCDGSATVDMVGGAGTTFTVHWDGAAGAQSTPTASNLCAGTYTVLITDDLGCNASTSVTINEPAVITTNPGFVDPSCFGYCDGQLGVVVAGGTAPYTYQWRDALNTPFGPNNDTITGLCAGTYSLEITDANGCAELLNYTLTDPAQVTANVGQTDVICFGACDGTGTAGGVVGVGAFTYQWDAAAGNQTTATASGLCPGTYTCTVSDADGCFTSVTATIAEPPLLVTDITNFGHVTCNGACDGYAEVDVVGGTGPYSYDWGAAGATQQVTNLCAGTYTVTVTDANGCVSSSNVVISQPSPLGVTASSSNNSCYQSCDGTASVSVSGGTAPYNYQWDNPTFATTANVNGLCAGTWTCTITDANGCSITQSVIITEPSLLSVAVNSITNANCGQSNGEICISSIGGVAPFTYAWNDPSNTTTACLTGVPANCYQITVLDANGCSADSTICVDDITGPDVTVGAITDVSCFAAGDGSMDFNVTSVTGGLNYEFYDAAGNLMSSGLPVYTNLDGGSYYLQVTDAAGCIGQDIGFIAEPNALNSAVTSSANVTCNAACDGQAMVSVSGGSTPYTISWNDPTNQTTNLATGLCAGTWAATVTDDNLCTTTATIVITEPDPLAVSSVTNDVSCNGGNDGLINLSVTGGTPAYNYLWSPPASSGSLGSSLSAGNYVIDISDQNGCQLQTTITINEPPLLTLGFSAVNSTCSQCNGSASINVSGGTGPFTYLWLNGGSNPNAATNTQLCPGTHDVVVTDANGCSETIIVTINDEPAPTIAGMSFTQPSCNGLSDGTATVAALGGTGVLSYLWDAAAGSQSSATASGLAAGTYCVTVYDVNNCQATNCVTVTEPSPLNPVPDGSTTICYGDSTQVWASGAGGTPAYTINWSTAGFTGTGPIMVNPLTDTDYCFTVTDANGCVSPSACVTIEVLPQINIDMMPTTAICDGDPVDVVASASGGNGGPYTFTWTDDQGGSHTPAATGSPSTITDNPGSDTWYYVTVSDGCSLDEVDSVQVTIDALPTAFVNVVDSNGCAAFTADFILNTDIGVSFDYDFECDGIVDYSGTNPNPSNTYSTAGLYDVCVTVTSADGCQTALTAPGMVEVYPVPTAGFYPDPVTSTEVDPVITMYDQSSGADNYVWIFGDGDTVAGIASDLIGAVNTSGTIGQPEHFYDEVGTYTITQIVTNQFGCTDQITQTVTIDPEQTLFVPNSFTPNGDGKNDYFFPQGTSIDPENFTMYIFNRWGEIIFESHSLNQPWDGTVKGRNTAIAQEDVYVWLIKTRDLKGNDVEYKGHVTLLK